MDISTQINGLKLMRETTPAVAILPSGVNKKMVSHSDDIKTAKASEFGVKPVSATEKKKSSKC